MDLHNLDRKCEVGHFESDECNYKLETLFQYVHTWLQSHNVSAVVTK